MIRNDFKGKKERKFSLFGGKIRLRVLIAVSLMVISLVCTQLVFANNLAVDGKKLSEIDDEIKNLEAQNTSLKVEIAKASSMISLSKRADDLGFVKPQKINIL
ncbi:hypothetical protein A3A60_03440 [Candidatus Curtissbacteria bacterium RIFCSPLOWO2_01_FULL_42_26]|uniref:Cell division protein FtsL n=1 Tax=Candidatus Curtissbacteria bacterium RIFCSPLOWO2_01_FULL_42_26 TaxID=1797729 RepID=A0A1F5I4B1_9BACT|nr:MAG: hypothetical protein A3A60_03440 [Candidatus Curtissbacteria bacterium RIFCSPLOWO2_01_FULL_42_26]